MLGEDQRRFEGAGGSCLTIESPQSGWIVNCPTIDQLDMGMLGESRMSLPPSTVSVSSPEEALTPMNWFGDAYEDVDPLVINEGLDLDVDVEKLLNDLFPELCTGK